LREQYEDLKKYDIETLSSMFRDKARIFNGVRNKGEGENKRKRRNEEEGGDSKKIKVELLPRDLGLYDLPNELLVECMRFVDPDLQDILTTVRLLSTEFNKFINCYAMRTHIILTIPETYKFKNDSTQIDIPSYFDGVDGFRLMRHHTDETLLSLQRPIGRLEMPFCRNITDKGFTAMQGIYELDMSRCEQKGITDKAFEIMKGTIETLNVSYCEQITDKAFENFKGTIHTLGMSGCNQKEITDKAFRNMKGIHTLGMSMCNQKEITDKAFESLKGTIHTLNMNYCDQEEITNEAFKYLTETITHLDMIDLNKETVTVEAFSKLKGSSGRLNIEKLTQNIVPLERARQIFKDQENLKIS